MGILISIDGVDRVGKSYMVKNLSQALQNAGIVVETWGFPSKSGSMYGMCARNLLISSEDEHKIDPVEFMMLCAMDMYHIYHSILSPAVEAGKVVLCDRFVHSLLAYQSVLVPQLVNNDLGKTKAEALISNILEIPWPDSMFLLCHEIDNPEAEYGSDIMERQGPEFFDKVQTVFNIMAEDPGKQYGEIIKVTRNSVNDIIKLICEKFWCS